MVMSMNTRVVVQFNGTEVSVKLSPNSSAKVFIDGAKFDIRPTRHVHPDPVQTGITLKNYAFIDTPCEELVNLPNYGFIDEPVQTSFYGPPPPYDDNNEFSQNTSPPKYLMGEPPAYDPKDPNRIKHNKLRNFRPEYYLPTYSEIFDVPIDDRLVYLCMCDMCANNGSEIIAEKGITCNLWDYDEFCIGTNLGDIYEVGYSIPDYSETCIKVSVTLKIAIFPYLRFQRFQIDMLESFLLQKKLDENIISVQRYRG